jgi:very-short-patch-repair endonuclease
MAGFCSKVIQKSKHIQRLSPLPKGEGQGEGKHNSRQTTMPPATLNLTPLARNLRKRDTWAEKLLWTWLRDRRFSAYKFRRQQIFGAYILDFLCVEAFLNIELDGSGHGHPEQKRKDEERDAWLANAGVKVLRFWNARLRRDKEIVRNTLWENLQARAPHPLPEYCRPVIIGCGKERVLK